MTERVLSEVVELDLDKCTLSFGVSPCTAGIEDSGTAQAGAASTITLRAGASAVDDFYNGMTVRLTGGTGSGQERRITDYVGATKVATVETAWGTNPDATSTYTVIDRPNACYNTFRTCQDKANYSKGTQTLRFTGLGAPIDKSAPARPYISRLTTAPTELDLEEAISRRASSSVVLVDDTDADVELDPYVRDRATVARGTFWTRFFARHLNYAGRAARVKRTFVANGEFDIGVPAQYLSLPGTSGNYASTPYSAALDIVGEWEIEAICTPTGNQVVDCAVLSRVFPTEVPYVIGFNEAHPGGAGSPGPLVPWVGMYSSAAGGWHVVNAAAPVADGVEVKIVGIHRGTTLEIWINGVLSNTQTGVPAATPVTATGLRVGRRWDGDDYFNGKIRYCSVRNGIGGTVVARFDPSDALTGNLSFKSQDTGEVWTINQSGATPAKLVGSAVTERFIIEAAKGPDTRGEVTLSLKDPIKLLDRAKAPTPTSGKLALDFGLNDLTFTLDGTASQYAASGWVRIGDEVVRYASKSGEVFTLTDGTYRANFGSTASAHQIGDGVQQCLVYQNQTLAQIAEDLHNRGGILDADLDLAGLQAEYDTWLGADFLIAQVCITDPEDIAVLLKELLAPANMTTWWSPTEQKVKFKVYAPASPATIVVTVLDDTAELMDQSVANERLEDLRITFGAVNFGLRTAVDNPEEAKSYQQGELAVDLDAESANEYNERRVLTINSRFYGAGNTRAMRTFIQRYVARHRDAPERIEFGLDPKDGSLKEGEICDLQTFRLVEADGTTRTARVLIVRREPRGVDVKYAARITNFDRPYGFIAPDGTPNYPNNNGYACVSQDNGRMTNGDAGYLVI